MSECIRAIPRTEKVNKVRKDGFVPGVVYGGNLAGSQPVKFEEKRLKKLLRHTYDPRLQVKINNEITPCVIQEVQRDSITGKLIHIALQVINDKTPLKINVPVIFSGQDVLQRRRLALQITRPEIMIRGRQETLPEYVEIDVSTKRLGDKITVADVPLKSNIRVINAANEILAVVTIAKLGLAS
ncbi:50S ribosomal protein L25 [Anaeroselena agilis]|uniref:Large ribosomal subunit protein bL25 n=1 Tax=Anaeroselena agilis TaxID=3063788 RepID=A0ABU3NU62_9FIRM|nr:50S ribosomal protein L25 [Selenomonadales bacterium 4137-cl]